MSTFRERHPDPPDITAAEKLAAISSLSRQNPEYAITPRCFLRMGPSDSRTPRVDPVAYRAKRAEPRDPAWNLVTASPRTMRNASPDEPPPTKRKPSKKARAANRRRAAR